MVITKNDLPLFAIAAELLFKQIQKEQHFYEALFFVRKSTNIPCLMHAGCLVFDTHKNDIINSVNLKFR